MALPARIVAASPADLDNPKAGAAEVRALKQFLEDVFGLTDNVDYTASGITVSPSGAITLPLGGAGPLKYVAHNEAVVDDATIILPAVTSSGYGIICVGTALTAYAQFVVSSTGTVVAFNNTANVVVNADTDSKLCLATTTPQPAVQVKNRLGASYHINLAFWYD